jgi:hypothetical protein
MLPHLRDRSKHLFFVLAEFMCRNVYSKLKYIFSKRFLCYSAYITGLDVQFAANTNVLFQIQIYFPIRNVVRSLSKRAVN